MQPWAAWLASLGFRLLNCKISRDEDGTRRSTPGVRDGPWGSHTSPEPLSQLHERENRASGRLLTTIITLIMATLCPRRQQREEPDAGQERPAKRERQDRKVTGERPSYQTDKTLLKEPQLQLDPEHVPNTNLLGPKARMTPWSDGHVPTCFTPHSRWPLTPTSSPSSNGRPGFKEPAPIKAPLTQGRARVGPGLAPAGNDKKTAALTGEEGAAGGGVRSADRARPGTGRGPGDMRGAHICTRAGTRP